MQYLLRTMRSFPLTGALVSCVWTSVPGCVILAYLSLQSNETYLGNRKHVRIFMITWSKHARSWENIRVEQGSWAQLLSYSPNFPSGLCNDGFTFVSGSEMKRGPGLPSVSILCCFRLFHTSKTCFLAQLLVERLPSPLLAAQLKRENPKVSHARQSVPVFVCLCCLSEHSNVATDKAK